MASHFQALDSSHRHFPDVTEPAKKKRRSSKLGAIDIPADINARKQSISGPRDAQDTYSGEERDVKPPTTGSAKAGGQTVAPFLTRHIPDQYAPLGKPRVNASKDPNSKYCYRHHPDLKCRRQADEPSMDQLQKDLDTLSEDDRQGIAHVWSLFSAAPAKHRNLMLRGILAGCCFPQLSMLSASVKELIRIDFLSALPPELSFKILCFLDTTSLCKAAQVSQRWRELADDDVVWHRMCEQHIGCKCTKCGWGLPSLEKERLRASKRQIQLRATGRGLNTWSPDITPNPESFDQEDSEHRGILRPGNNASSTPPESTGESETYVNALKDEVGSYPKSSKSEIGRMTRPWKDVYQDRFKVGLNWKYGRCSVKTFRGHDNGVMCLQFSESILATGSYDASIKIWDLNSAEEIRSLKGHRLGIRCLQFDHTKLISGSLDQTIKIWRLKDGECLSTLEGHVGGVIGLHFVGNLLASASTDRTIKVWNFDDKSVFTLQGHTDWVNAVKLDVASNTLLSASDDCTLRLWDLERKVCLREFDGHVAQVQQIVTLPPEFEIVNEQELSDESASPESGREETPNSDDDIEYSGSSLLGPASAHNRPAPPRYMLSGALDSTIRLWEVSTGRCLRAFFGHVEGVWALAADTLRIVSGSQDRTVKIWDPRTGKCERTFAGHAAPVTCVGLSDSRICTGSEDCEVKMYSFTNDEPHTPISLS
ncbi:MAG: hypothetical protein Q9227_004294 [Pyrenula ochraceoflavens]